MIENTVEIWKGEYRPEEGNMVLAGSIHREGYYGIVVDIPIGPSLVCVEWWPKKQKKRRALPENKGHQAVERVLHTERLNVRQWNERKAEDREAERVINQVLAELKRNV